MSLIYKALVLLGLLAGAQLSALSATAVQPVRDDEVLEVLQTVTRKRPVQIDLSTGRAAGAAGQAAGARAEPADPVVAAQLARQDISVARQTGDTRYWGRAQAALAHWWDRCRLRCRADDTNLQLRGLCLPPRSHAPLLTRRAG